MERVILGLGSNRGEKKQNLKNATDALSGFLEQMVLSSVYRTSPQDYLLQDDFYNMVVSGLFEGMPLELLKKINKIESENGREREKEVPKGPRTLDIDILFFGKYRINTPELTIPHPAIKARAFVLVPLLELFPDFKEDASSLCYKDLLGDLGDQRVEKIFKF